jgi:hypothetical protein
MDNIMDNIINPSSSFDFMNLSLAKPTGVHGGSYFTKILCNKKPLYIQSTSLTKNGFIKSGKKYFCDLLFDNNSEELINWFEKLEIRCHELVYEKSSEWFNGTFELTDIESAFNPILKLYKSGKCCLVRTNIQINSLTNLPNIKIYDEHENNITMEDVAPNTNIISILEIQGIKVTNKNFQFEIALIQVMVLNNYSMFENCLIKHNQSSVIYNDKKDLEQFNPINNSQVKSESLPVQTEDILVENTNTDVIEETNIHNENDEIEALTKLINEHNSEHNSNTSGLNLEIEDLDIIPYTENNKDLKEVELSITLDNTLKPITLKKPNEVYYKIYKEAKDKAKQAKKQAAIACLEAINIKNKYMLDDLDESDTDIDEESYEI